jgi:hypothetical protein
VDQPVDQPVDDVSPTAHDLERDPFAPVVASPRGAGVLVAIAAVLALAALLGGLSPIAGPVGMLVGLVAHVKGHRLGMPLTVAAGIAMIVGMSFSLYLR